jgi:hypothetical protein
MGRRVRPARPTVSSSAVSFIKPPTRWQEPPHEYHVATCSGLAQNDATAAAAAPIDGCSHVQDLGVQGVHVQRPLVQQPRLEPVAQSRLHSGPDQEELLVGPVQRVRPLAVALGKLWRGSAGGERLQISPGPNSTAVRQHGSSPALPTMQSDLWRRTWAVLGSSRISARFTATARKAGSFQHRSVYRKSP